MTFVFLCINPFLQLWGVESYVLTVAKVPKTLIYCFLINPEFVYLFIQVLGTFHLWIFDDCSSKHSISYHDWYVTHFLSALILKLSFPAPSKRQLTRE